MLTAIQLREEDNTILLTLPIGAPSSSQDYFIKSADGLGPVKADIVTSSWAGQDGGVYQNGRVSYRNIVLNVGLNPNYAGGRDVAYLRERLYEFFPPKSQVNLIFLRNDNIRDTVKISGFVESHEPDIFTNKVGAQISIICPDPYFVHYYVGSINATTGVPVDMSTFGSAPTGFMVDLTFERNVGSWYIDVFGFDRILIRGDYRIGDKVRVSTVSGDKYMVKERAGTTTIDLSSLDSGSLNTTVDSRTRSFVTGFTSGGEQPYKLWYTPRYVGV